MIFWIRPTVLGFLVLGSPENLQKIAILRLFAYRSLFYAPNRTDIKVLCRPYRRIEPVNFNNIKQGIRPYGAIRKIRNF